MCIGQYQAIDRCTTLNSHKLATATVYRIVFTLILFSYESLPVADLAAVYF